MKNQDLSNKNQDLGGNYQDQRNSYDWRKSGIMFVLGDRKERQGQVYSFAELWCAKDSAKALYSEIIKIIFSQHFMGLETWAMPQRKKPFCFSKFQTKQKSAIFACGIGKMGYSYICTELSRYPD